VAVAPERRRRTPIYEGSRIPQPIPSVRLVPEELRRTDDILEVNFGPNHPSTHGVLGWSSSSTARPWSASAP